MNEPVHPAQLLFSEKHPLTSVFDMRFVVPDKQRLEIHVEAPAAFAGQDGERIHTGFATLLLDTAMGSCAIGELKKAQPIATVKLNVNHLFSPRVGEPLVCNTVYDGEENGIAYVSGNIRRVKDGRLISTAIGTFMIGTATRSIREKTG